VTAAYRLVALHGFLGRPSDWDGPARWFPATTVSAIDLWRVLDQPAVTDWVSASRALAAALADALAGGDRRPAFLVAYSFGARLALSASWPAAAAVPVRGCCFVSCHPGLAADDREARLARRASDEAWAERILAWPEDEIWRAWDAQPVFGEAEGRAPRAGLPAPREVLARAMRLFSLAGQPDFRPRLRRWPTPVLWVTGARDAKFSALARDVSAAGVPAAFVACEDAGHRVPWDNPSAFARAVGGWIGRVMET
jgi:2-succinyl-6-hydroxy-2,4-cyclohexadiene-1-carboxylate synthase